MTCSIVWRKFVDLVLISSPLLVQGGGICVIPILVFLKDRVDELSGRDVVGVEADQSHDEDTIVTEVLVGELLG